MERDKSPEVMAMGPATADACPVPVSPLPEQEVRRLLSEPSLLAQLADILAVMDEQIRFLYVSRTAGDRSVDDVVGKSVLAHIPSDCQGAFVEAFHDAWRTEQPRVVEASSNEELWWETRLVPIRGADGVKRMVATTVDITRRKLAERALRESESRLRESESRLRDALAISGVGSWSWNERDDSIVWDDNLCAIFAIPRELVPTNVEDYYRFMLPEDAPLVRAHSCKALQTGVFGELEFRIVRTTGEVRHLVARGERTYDDAGRPTGLRGGMIDVTERKRLEERVRQAHKMEAVGQLTAGIAHNFNNLLGIILPNATLCQSQASPFVLARLQDIEHAATRAADLVRQLMLFTRKEGASEKRPVNLASTAQRTVTICRATFGPGIELVLHDSPHLPSVLGREGELEQVLLNVLLNARHAMLDAQVAAPRVILTLSQAAPNQVRLTIDDNGPGVPAELRTRIFEPFFTTKDVGKGTGLGLATCYAVVQEHEGTIWAEESPANGTRIAIELPASSPDRAVSEPPESAHASSAKLRILLVDDEPLLRRVVRMVLESGGYDVHEAESGQQALSLLAADPQVRLLIVDQAMPGMSGEQVLSALRESGRAIPTLLFTGHLDAREISRASAVLIKPAHPRELLDTVRTLLEQGSG